MSIQSLKRKFIGVRGSLGKIGLNAVFPNDFELYIFAFELVDSKGNTEEYFIFPINPTSFDEVSTANTSIIKTAGGVVVMNSNTFIPIDISMSGNFGRRFKILIGQEMIDFSSLSFSSVSGFFQSFKEGQNFKKSIFSSRIKTGYGCIKILQTIINKSHGLDQYNKPYSLFLYNLALGNNYLVKALNLVFKQDMSNNMIWNYTLQLKALGTIESIKGDDSKSLQASLSFSKGVQSIMNQQLNNIKKILQ